jgi:hypothetical protein
LGSRKRELERMFYRDDFPAACLWPRAAKGYRLKDEQIEPISLDDWLPNAPLSDPELFVSFAKLGSRGEPSENRCLRWVQKYGLLRRQKESEGWAIVRREPTGRGISDPDLRKAEARRLAYAEARRTLLAELDELGASLDDLSSEQRKIFDERVAKIASVGAWYKEMNLEPTVKRWTLNQAPISLDDFRAEVSNARSALGLYEVLRKGDVTELSTRVEATREKEAHVVLSEVDEGLARIGDEVLNTRWTDTLIFRAALVLESFVKQKVANVELDFFDFTDKPIYAPVYAPVQSWSCPDLLSAVYLQLYIWMIKAWPMRICANEPCSTPFPATRTDKRFCTDACRSAARNHR